MGEELENFSRQLEIVNTYQLSNKLAYILGILVDKLSLDIRTAIGLMSSCIDMLKQVELDPELELRVLYLLYEGNFGKAREVLREHTTNRQRLGQINRDRSSPGSFDAPKKPSLSVYQPQTASTRETFQPQTASTRETFQPQNLSYEAQRQRHATNYGQDRESEPPLQYPKEQTNPPFFNNPDVVKPNTASIPSFSDHSQYRPTNLAPNLPNPTTTSSPSFPSYSQYQPSSLLQDKPDPSTQSVTSIDYQNVSSALYSETSNYKQPLPQEFKPPQPSFSTYQYPQHPKQPFTPLAHVELPPGVNIRHISNIPTPQGPAEMTIQKPSSNTQSSSDFKNQSQPGSEASEERDIPLYESVRLPNESRTWNAYEDVRSEKTNKAEENMPKVDFMNNPLSSDRGYTEEFKNISYNPVSAHDSTIKLPSQENPGRNIAYNPIAPYDPKTNLERNPESQQDLKFKPTYQFQQGPQATQETAPQISNIYQAPGSNYIKSVSIPPYNPLPNPQSNPYSNNPIYPPQALINPSLQYNPASVVQHMHFLPSNVGYKMPVPGSVPQNSSYQFDAPTTTVPYRGYEATPGSDRSVPMNPAIESQTAKPPSQDLRAPSAITTSNKGFNELYNMICKLCNSSLHGKPQIKLRCGHSIHKECLKAHVKSPYNNKATCPIDTCYAEIDEKICSSIFESQETSSTPYQAPQKSAINCASSINISEDLRK